MDKIIIKEKDFDVNVHFWSTLFIETIHSTLFYCNYQQIQLFNTLTPVRNCKELFYLSCKT